MAVAYIDDGITSMADDEDEGPGTSTGSAGRRHPPPSLAPSERVVYVGDDGLVDSAAENASVYEDVEELTADFRHQLGLLPEEEQELSEAFKATIGLTAFEQERLDRLAKDKHGTVENFAFEKFAGKYFRKGFKAKFSADALSQPILSTDDRLNIKAAPLIFRAVQRFMEHGSEEIPEEEMRPKKSVMSLVYQLMNPYSSINSSPSSSSSSSSSPSSSTSSSPVITEAKISELDRQSSMDDSPSTPKNPDRKSKMFLKKLLRISSSEKKQRSAKKSSSDEFSEFSFAAGSGRGSDSDDPEAIPRAELDLVHYIIAHGIVKPSLRDEILCQLCCQVTDNPSPKSRERGWMLIALCAGCFLPSNHFINYFFAFLHGAPPEVNDFSRYIMVILRRTNANGARYHPPSWVELQAVKLRKYPVMQVGTPDGRVIPVESDPATTAWEVCVSIAKTIGVKDLFGFSIYVGVQRKISSLGSGSDHVMDAISECEQMIRVEQGVSEEKSSWKIYFQKELFTPWHNPDVDLEATNLIYHQILDGIHRGDYALLPEEVPKMVARIFYIEHGPEVDLDLVRTRIDEYLPKTMTANSKSRDQLIRSVMSAFNARGYSNGVLSTRQIKNQAVAVATSLWPLNFSAMFEALRHSGPPLPRNDVVLAVNGEGVFILDARFKTLVAFHYYDVVDCVAGCVNDIRKSTVSFITLDGAQFTFLSPNSSTIHKIVTLYLEGLRRRSRWAVALQSFQLQDYTGGSGVDFRLRQGDIVELKDETRHPLLRTSWLYGRCERTGAEGSFPHEIVYVLPTAERPSDRFLGMFRSMGRDQMNTLPKRSAALILSGGTIGRHQAHGLESCA